MPSVESSEVEQSVIQCNSPIGKVNHSGWLGFQKYKMSLYIDVESIIDLVDVY
jgi:hypothetical protein